MPPEVTTPPAAAAATSSPTARSSAEPVPNADAKALAAHKNLVSSVFNKTPAPAAAAPASPTTAATSAPPAPKKRTSIMEPPSEAAPAKVEPAAEPAPAADDFPESKITIDPTSKEPVRKNFEQLRTITKEQRQRATAAERERDEALAKLKAQTAATPMSQQANDPEIARLKEEHRQALDRLAVLDLESHPDFHRQYVAPRNAALKEAGEILGWNGKGEANLEAVLAKSPKEFSAAVSELTKDMNAMDAQSVQAALRNAYKLTGERAQRLSQSSELAKQLAAKTQAESETAFVEVAGSLGEAGDYLAKLEVADDAPPERRSEVEAYNASLSGVNENAKRYAFGRLSPKEQALVAHKAALMDHVVKHHGPQIRKEFARLHAENRALAKAYAELKAAKGGPAPVGDGKSAQGGQKPGTIKDLVSQTFGRR